ncbi:hypothetical protein ACH5RR_021527 [Cinchona calisaya]|uniref:Uncharacterized protein n=1 Tax=Cinchona calisaya TaxID=153742 RepID=A0ABD2ZHT1_9GENT
MQTMQTDAWPESTNQHILKDISDDHHTKERMVKNFKDFLFSLKAGSDESIVKVSSSLGLSGISTTSQRKELQESLCLIGATISKSWAIGEDFNVIESLAEYSGTARHNRQAMADFSDMIMNCGLKNLSFSGSSYTWSGVRHGWPKMGRSHFNSKFVDTTPFFFSYCSGQLESTYDGNWNAVL